MAFGATPLDGSATPIPMSSSVPDGGNSIFALEGGPSKVTGGNTLAPAAVYHYDGYDVCEGTTTDAAAVGDVVGTISAKLRGLSKNSVSNTSALTLVAASVTDVALLAANSSRKGYRVFNDSTSIMYLAESTAVTTSLYTTQVGPGVLWESPMLPIWQGAVHALWVTATGNARITELS